MPPVNFLVNFSLGGAAPQTPWFLAGGGKAPPDPTLKRSFVTFDRGGQTGPPRSNYFFGAADDTRRRRPSADPIDTKERSEKKKKFFFFLGLGSQAWVPINMKGMLQMRDAVPLVFISIAEFPVLVAQWNHAQ